MIHEDIAYGRKTLGDKDNLLKLNRAINVRKASDRVVTAIVEFEDAVDKRWRSIR